MNPQRPNLLTDAERAQITRPATREQRRTVLAFFAKNLEQMFLADGMTVDFQWRDTGGFTLTVDMPNPGPEQVTLP